MDGFAKPESFRHYLAINDLMSASDEFTLQGNLYSRNQYGGGEEKPNAFHRTISVWGVYDTKNDKDYYYVQQKVRMEIGGKQEIGSRWDLNKTLYHGPYEGDYWFDGDFTYEGVRYQKYYGSWLDSYLSKLKLTGQGTIRIEQAIPMTDKNDVSTSVSTGHDHSETGTLGFSVGASVGFMEASVNYSVNASYGWTDGTSFSMTTTNNAKELKCTKNTTGSEVTWKYECGQKMNVYEDYNQDHWHTLASDALTNDVDIDNQVCWSVTNPVGSYQLRVFEEPTMCSIVKQKGKLVWATNSGWMTFDKNYTFKIPNRAIQEWSMNVTFPEIGQEGHHGDKSKLEETLQRHFPNFYQPTLTLADQTADSENTISRLVNLTKARMKNGDAAQTLREFALDLGLSQFTIKWYSNNPKQQKYELTVKAKEE